MHIDKRADLQAPTIHHIHLLISINQNSNSKKYFVIVNSHYLDFLSLSLSNSDCTKQELSMLEVNEVRL